MISIIIRCRNRLEYTIQCLNWVKLNTSDMEYEVILVDNASSDGTREWIDWMQKNTSWYSNMKVLHMDRNCGDWGGMLAGFQYSTGDYIVQLDNDIQVPEQWLYSLKYALDNTDYEVVMLKRDNVAWKLPVKKAIRLPNGLHIGQVERPVACYITTRSMFTEFANHIKESQGSKSKYMIRSLTKGMIGKVTNVRCLEMEAEYQRTKYDPKNPQIWEKV
jgi:glycosyltransferase involved in cell wall biosynthesis